MFIRGHSFEDSMRIYRETKQVMHEVIAYLESTVGEYETYDGNHPMYVDGLDLLERLRRLVEVP